MNLKLAVSVVLTSSKKAEKEKNLRDGELNPDLARDKRPF